MEPDNREIVADLEAARNLFSRRRESDDITRRRYGRSSYEAFCATRSYVGTFALHNLLAAFRSPCIRIRDGYDDDSPRHRSLAFETVSLAISNRPFPFPPSPPRIRGNSRRQPPATRFLRGFEIIISFFERFFSLFLHQRAAGIAIGQVG